MIPKKIHYCWFGGNEKSTLAKKCINSWKKYCPDYEIIEWNENNFDVTQNDYLKFCYGNKEWAFLSDMARLMIIYSEGGIYFDTDVEVVRAFDDLLKYDLFIGFENNSAVNTGQGFGAVAHNEIVLEMMHVYLESQKKNIEFFELIPCPALNTRPFVKRGLRLDGSSQMFTSYIVLAADFLNPYDDPTGVLMKTKNTFSIHWYGKSWMSKDVKMRSTIIKPFHRIFGVDCFKRLKK